MKFNKGNMLIKTKHHANKKHIFIITKQRFIITKQRFANFNNYNCEYYDYIEFIFCAKESKLLKTYIHKKYPIYNPHKYKKFYENVYIRKCENL